MRRSEGLCGVTRDVISTDRPDPRRLSTVEVDLPIFYVNPNGEDPERTEDGKGFVSRNTTEVDQGGGPQGRVGRVVVDVVRGRFQSESVPEGGGRSSEPVRVGDPSTPGPEGSRWFCTESPSTPDPSLGLGRGRGGRGPGPRRRTSEDQREGKGPVLPLRESRPRPEVGGTDHRTLCRSGWSTPTLGVSVKRDLYLPLFNEIVRLPETKFRLKVYYLGLMKGKERRQRRRIKLFNVSIN